MHLEALLNDQLPGERQNDASATYAAKLDKAEAELDWTRPATELLRRINAFNPWPVAQSGFRGQVLRIWRACRSGESTAEAPGTVLHGGRDGVDVACGEEVLRLLEVQLPGGRRISAADFSNSQSPAGERLQPVSIS